MFHEEQIARVRFRGQRTENVQVKVLNLARAKVASATSVRSVISTREKYSKYQIAFRKEWETRESSTSSRLPSQILHSLSVVATDGMLDSPVTDVRNEDGCVKTRRIDVNRANLVSVTVLVLLPSFFKRALLSRLSQDRL